MVIYCNIVKKVFLHLAFLSQMPIAKSKIAVAFGILSSGGFPKPAGGSCPRQYRQESWRWNSDRGGEGKFVCRVLYPIQKKGVLNTSVFDVAVSSIQCSWWASDCAKDKRAVVSALSCLQFAWERYSALEGQLAFGVGHVFIKTGYQIALQYLPQY